ncbi:adaptor protein MecA [Alicyclobacillaceae bacterium I2511]|jgi:adapter protein MecA 1/2|nr:adaptor protein MecA [Alicyclobacillaceae bacterium I2511]
MRVERIARNKVRIFISYEDLEKRGIDRNELWKNGRKVQELFWDMMETAYEQTGFEIVGPVSIEAFTMPTEGVVVIVTRVPALPMHNRSENADEEEDFDEEEDYGLADDGDSGNSLSLFALSPVFRFDDMEDAIRAAHAMISNPPVSTVYKYQGVYYVTLEESELTRDEFESAAAALLEYGEKTSMTDAFLFEYAELLLDGNGLAQLAKIFPLS